MVKATINRSNPYMEMPFQSLVDIVFNPSRELNSCSKHAIRALIVRLERFYETDGFGCARTCRINEMDAYLASAMIIAHDWDA